MQKGHTHIIIISFFYHYNGCLYQRLELSNVEDPSPETTALPLPEQTSASLPSFDSPHSGRPVAALPLPTMAHHVLTHSSLDVGSNSSNKQNTKIRPCTTSPMSLQPLCQTTMKVYIESRLPHTLKSTPLTAVTSFSASML